MAKHEAQTRLQRGVPVYNVGQGADGSGIAKPRDSDNPGWKETPILSEY